MKLNTLKFYHIEDIVSQGLIEQMYNLSCFNNPEEYYYLRIILVKDLEQNLEVVIDYLNELDSNKGDDDDLMNKEARKAIKVLRKKNPNAFVNIEAISKFEEVKK